MLPSARVCKPTFNKNEDETVHPSFRPCDFWTLASLLALVSLASGGTSSRGSRSGKKVVEECEIAEAPRQAFATEVVASPIAEQPPICIMLQPSSGMPPAAARPQFITSPASQDLAAPSPLGQQASYPLALRQSTSVVPFSGSPMAWTSDRLPVAAIATT